MKITIVTLFPGMIRGFLGESMVKRAQDTGRVDIEVVQLRDFAVDSHGTVDDRPFGGGAGMLLMAEPIVRAISKTRGSGETRISGGSRETRKLDEARVSGRTGGGERVVLTSPRGGRYDQDMALEYAGLDHLIIVAGHYEGVDERAMSVIDEEVSVGDYVLTGGELPAAIIVDSVVRLLPGVLKKEDAAAVESFFKVEIDELEKAVGRDLVLQAARERGQTHIQLLEYPHYTRPQTYDGQEVPEIVLSGNHAEIRKWQLQQAFSITKSRRPDLFIKIS